MRLVACIGVSLLLLLGVMPAAAEGANCPAPGWVSPVMYTHTPVIYPAAAVKAREQGPVLLMVNIGVDGTPTEVAVTRSSGAQRLDEAAAEYIRRQWRWKLPPEECEPSPIQMPVLVSYHLFDSHPPKFDFAVRMPATEYPPGAAERLEVGHTYLEITTDESGAIKDGRVAFSSGYADLDDKALALAKASPRTFAKNPGTRRVVLVNWSVELKNLETVVMSAVTRR